MIKEINEQVNRVNKKIGLDIVIPMPSKTTLKTNEKVNIAVSITCLSIGILTTSKWLIGLGVLGGISATFAHMEIKKL